MSVDTDLTVGDAVQKRIGRYIGTLNGRKFYPLDPRTEEVHPEDIAHSLSHKCRWGGYTKRIYSVGEHILHGMQLGFNMPLGDDENLRRDIIKYYFLHDAHEAYLADMPSPVKPSIVGWREFEDAIDLAIWERFGLDPIPDDIRKYVHIIDRWSLGMEVDTVIDRLEDTYYPDPPRAALALKAPISSEYVPTEVVKANLMEGFKMLFPDYV